MPSTARGIAAASPAVDDPQVDPSRRTHDDPLPQSAAAAGTSVPKGAFEKTSSDVLEKYSALYERLVSDEMDEEFEAPDSSPESKAT